MELPFDFGANRVSAPASGSGSRVRSNVPWVIDTVVPPRFLITSTRASSCLASAATMIVPRPQTASFTDESPLLGQRLSKIAHIQRALQKAKDPARWAPLASSTSFQAQVARFRFSPDSGRIGASHRSATKSADARRGAAVGSELRQAAGAAAWVAADKRGVTRLQPLHSRESA